MPTIEIAEGINATGQIGSCKISVLILNEFMALMQGDLEDGFLNSSEFATPIQYIYPNGEVQLINGIIDEEFYKANTDSRIDVLTLQPFVIIQTNSLKKEPTEDDLLIIRGKKYKVMRHEPDGTGTSMIYYHFQK